MASLLIAGASAMAQKLDSKNVPAPVLQGFNKLYPDVVSAKWELEDGKYEVEFKKNGVESEVVLSNEGALIQTEKELSSPNDLPQPVLSTLKKDFAGGKYKDAEVVETADGKTLYKVEVKDTTGSFELLFDNKGTLVKKTAEVEEEKEKEGRGKERKEKGHK